jgi:DNA repair protein RecO (recombination protein O)
LITKTEIIVFRTIDYSESSMIATVLSREHGKIALMVRGARKPKSKFSGMIQPGNILKAVYYYKSSRNVQTLSEASYSTRLKTLSVDIEKMALSTCALELIAQLVHDNEVNEPVFDFTRNFLEWLDVQESISRKIFPYLQIRLAFLLGLELQIQDLNNDDIGFLNIQQGAVSSKAQSSNAIRLTENQLIFLKNCSVSRKISIFDIDLNKNELRSLIDHLDKYFRYHLEGVRPRRSDAIFDQILNNSL